MKSLPTIEKPKPLHATMMQIAPGILAKTAEQNLDVHANHLTQLYRFAPSLDDSILTWTPFGVIEDISSTPTPTEIFTASRILNFSSPGKDLIRAEYLKAVCRNNNLFF